MGGGLGGGIDGGEGAAGGEGGVGGVTGGDGGPGSSAQMVQPVATSAPSVYQDIVSPTAMATLLGPAVPLYVDPPTTTLSKLDSVLKVVAVTRTSLPAVSTHDASLLYVPPTGTELTQQRLRQLLSMVQDALPEVKVQRAIGGDGGGEGAGGDSGGYCVEAGQMVQPMADVIESAYHVNVSPPTTETALGPVVPLYCVPPMVSKSNASSVANAVDERLVGEPTVTTHVGSMPTLG